MKSSIIFFVAILFMATGFIIALTHILGMHQKFYSFVFFLIGGGLYQFAGFLYNKENH